ncbi:MAG: hypothetical protein IJ190_05790 [Prevotella sp.]|nr:hypothetical protein [Prevotella sp.]
MRKSVFLFIISLMPIVVGAQQGAKNLAGTYQLTGYYTGDREQHLKCTMRLTISKPNSKGEVVAKAVLKYLPEGYYEGFTYQMKGSFDGKNLYLDKEENNYFLTYEGVFDGKTFKGEYTHGTVTRPIEGVFRLTVKKN